MRTHLAAILVLAILACAGCGGGAASPTDDGSGAGMNLRITSASITSSPGAPVKNGPVTISVVVANNGTSATPATTYSYAFGGTTVTSALPSVAAGTTESISFVVTRATAGTSAVTVTLDPANTVNEREEGDNAVTVDVTWTESSLRNIAISNGSVDDSTLAVGASATLRFTLAYDTTDIIGPALWSVKWRVVRADDETKVVAEVTTTNSFSIPVSIVQTFADPTAVGAQEYLLQADYLGTVAESLETDNVFAFTITWSASG